MKTLKYIAMVLGTVSLITSCDSMEDTYNEYINGGEIVYRAKAKEVLGYPGYNRAKLTWTLEFPTQVVKCQIREGDEVLAEIPVEYKDKVELEYMLTDQLEKTHTYSVYSLDSEGNSSIKSDVIVDVYGERYASSLRTGRSIQAVLWKADDPATVLLKLSDVTSEKVIATDISYKSVSGDKTVRMDPGINDVILTDVAANSGYSLSDIWVPTTNTITLDGCPAAAKEYAASELPMSLARTFTTLYKTDATTIFAELSSANTEAGVSGSVISYGDKEVVVEPATNQVVLTDVPADAEISIVTKVVSGETEYQTAVSKVASSTLVTQIAMDNWTVLEFSSQQESGEGAGGGHASHAIDGDLNTFWHTQYSPNKPGYPHYMVIDMQEAATIQAVAVARRNNNANFASKMRLEVSSDHVNWEVAGEFMPDNTINGLQMFRLTNPLSGQYVKLTAVSGATSEPYFCLSEVNLYK